MAEKYRFFDAVLQEDGVTYDREYDAQEFTDYFKALVTTGVMKGAGNQLAVTANGSNMITKIDTGIAFLLGRYYENDSFKELTHDTETLGNSRIDRIVVRMDLSTEARYVKAFIKKGTPSANPVPPALTQTPNLYEISLAQVKIMGGQTFIATNAVTDERGKDVICPWAGSNILPSFDDNALAEHIKTKATTTQEGHVQLNDTLTSSSTTQAATANAVRQVNDRFTLPARINAVLESGWVNFANENAQPLTFYKDGFGVVHLYGNVVKRSRSPVTVLPEGYRPTGTREYLVQNGGDLPRPLFIFADGRVESYFNDINTNIIINVSYPTT